MPLPPQRPRRSPMLSLCRLPSQRPLARRVHRARLVGHRVAYLARNPRDRLESPIAELERDRAAGIDPDRPDDDPDPREDVLVVTDGRRVGRAHDADDLALGHPRAELLDLLPVEVATTGRAAGRDYERHRECEQGDSGTPTD